MTTTTVTIKNPAWDYVKDLPREISWRGAEQIQRWPRSADRRAWERFVDHRRRVTTKWTWAIPDPMVVAEIVAILDGRPVIEIGAGNGYWAWLLSQRGVDVAAYDRAPVGSQASWFRARSEFVKEDPGFDYTPQEFYPVARGGVEAVNYPENKDRVLFMCWPPYGTNMAYHALRRYEGETFLYIGEDYGGCNGDDRFHCLLGADSMDMDAHRGKTYKRVPKTQWDLVEDHPLLQWDGINDLFFHYERRP